MSKAVKKAGKAVAKKAGQKAARKPRGNPRPSFDLMASRGLEVAQMKMFEPDCPEVTKFELVLGRGHGMNHAGLRHFARSRMPSFKYYNPTATVEVRHVPKPTSIEDVTALLTPSHINVHFATGKPARLETTGMDSDDIYAELIKAARGTDKTVVFETPEMPPVPAPVFVALRMDKTKKLTLTEDSLRDDPHGLLSRLPHEYAVEIQKQLLAIRDSNKAAAAAEAKANDGL